MSLPLLVASELSEYLPIQSLGVGRVIPMRWANLSQASSREGAARVDVMAAIARACGFELVLRGHGVVIELGE